MGLRFDRPLRHTVSSPHFPIAFEANHGQTDREVNFIARHGAYTLFLTPREAVIRLNRSHTDEVLRLGFRGAEAAQVIGEQESGAHVNYFIGNDPRRWRVNVPVFEKVRYAALYPNVDLVYYGNGPDLEYDFVVAPGGDPNQIHLHVEGASRTSLDSEGNLVLKVGEEAIRFLRPKVYQDREGRKLVDGEYVVDKGDEVSFRVGPYDHSQPLVIDPVLTYSTFLGGRSIYYQSDWGWTIAVDNAGNAYVAGQAASLNFPTTPNAFQPTAPAFDLPVDFLDAFVSKLDPTGTRLIYSTYLGGKVSDWATSIAVDESGNAYIGGYTSSTNFPTMNAFQSSLHCTPNEFGQPGCTPDADSFVAKLNPSGSALLYSTFLGGMGEDYLESIAVDSTHNAYVGGRTKSADFPTRASLQQFNNGIVRPECLPSHCSDAFITKLSVSGSDLVYSTYVGGYYSEDLTSLAVDSAGNVYAAGTRGSPDFPFVNPRSRTGSGFVLKLNASGNALSYATALGGSSGATQINAIAVDDFGSAYVTGSSADDDFPTTANTIRSSTTRLFDTLSGSFRTIPQGFVTKLNAAGSGLIYSTFLPGRRVSDPRSIAVDSQGQAYIAGTAGSDDIQTPNPIFAGTYGSLIAKLNSAGSALLYATYLGQNQIEDIAIDSSGSVYVTGLTGSSLPLVNAFQAQSGGTIDKIYGDRDAFVAKISEGTTLQPFFALDPFTDGVSLAGTVDAAAPVTGFGMIQPNSGMLAPSGLAIYGLRQNNTIVSECGVAASPAVLNGRIFAQVDGPMNTGVAIANPNDRTVDVSFLFTGPDGVNFGSGHSSIPAKGQIARFLNDAPFNLQGPFAGTFTFNASLPVGVTALRGLNNQRGEFLITSMPVIDVNSTSTDTTYFPHFADGGGWTTQLVLVNPGDDPLSGTVQFWDQGSSVVQGTPVEVTIDALKQSSFPYTIPPRSARQFQTAGTSSGTQAGSIRVVPSGGSRSPGGFEVFSYTINGVTVTEAGVPAVRPGTNFRLYTELAGNFDSVEPGSIQTGFAVANTRGTPVNVSFELTSLSGDAQDNKATITVPANGQAAMLLTTLPGFKTLMSPRVTPVSSPPVQYLTPLPFKGLLRLSSNVTDSISVIGLRGRYNERSEYLITTTTPVNEATPAPSSPLIFPQLVQGGGYTSQIVVFSGSPSLTTAGMLRFFTQLGQAMDLGLR